MNGPGFHQHLSQRQTQQMVLAPQLRQSLKILQVAALDLRSVIQEELQNNPTLEEMPMDGVSLDQKTSESSRETASPDGTESREELDFSKSFEILTKIDDDWRDDQAQAGGGQQYSTEAAEKRQHFFDSLVSETSLQEHLMRQAELSDCPPQVLRAARYLVGSIDDRGFLTASPADIALMSGLALEDVQAAQKLLKTFDPPGIGALDLKDCLYFQLEAKSRGGCLAARIVRDHLNCSPAAEFLILPAASEFPWRRSRPRSRRSALWTLRPAGASQTTATASSCQTSPWRRTTASGGFS
jgi:RNA polymerase sigma-54 factor